MKTDNGHFPAIWIGVGLIALGWLSCSAGSGTSEVFFESKLQSSLVESAIAGRADDVKRLVAQGAKVNTQGRDGMTALILCLLRDSKAGIQCLLAEGADPNIQLTANSSADSYLTAGTSAMSIAAMHGDPWYLEIILKHRGKPNLINPIKHVTPIFGCIQLYDSKQTRIENVKLLVGAGASLNFRDANGYTPLHAAANVNRYDIVYTLLAAGADPTIVDNWGKTILTPMKRARTAPNSPLYQWRLEVTKMLKEKGMDIEDGD